MRKKNIVKGALLALLVCLLAAVFAFAGCSPQLYVVSVHTGPSGEVIVEYSDGSTATVGGGSSIIYNDVSVEELYEYYKEQYGDISYEEFLQMYLTAGAGVTEISINRAALSTLRVYSEARMTNDADEKDLTLGIGSGTIYRMESTYTYILTNYHVVYRELANEDNDGPAEGIGQKLTVYLYGSESVPQKNTEELDELGYPTYDYGKYAIGCEYVGGSVSLDVAVLRTETQNFLDVNPQARAVTWADEYHVGEAAFTIGNEDGRELTATQGIVSVERENIELEIGGVTRTYSLLRMDTPIYGGNSGGGLFNADGEMIGICNAGRTNMDNINFAVPLYTARYAAENIIAHYLDGDSATFGAYDVTLGITVEENNARFVFDESLGYGRTMTDVTITEVAAGSLAEQMGARVGDVLSAIVIDGVQYDLRRMYEPGDVLLNVRAGSEISFILQRGGEQVTGSAYTVQASDLVNIE